MQYLIATDESMGDVAAGGDDDPLDSDDEGLPSDPGSFSAAPHAAHHDVEEEEGGGEEEEEDGTAEDARLRFLPVRRISLTLFSLQACKPPPPRARAPRTTHSLFSLQASKRGKPYSP